jgi:predicted enzyme related to lactoylglutathione lyase
MVDPKDGMDGMDGMEGDDRMLHGLDLVLIEVPSVAALRDFYINTLGFELELDGQQFIQLRRPGADGASLALSESADAKPTSNPQMWWYVDGADATCAELAQRGVRIGEQPHDLPFGRVFSFHDPAGNTLYMLELR